MESRNNKKVVIIGAGPVGLAAAAHLLSRNITPIVLEKGQTAGAAISDWGHVQVFTPWEYLLDKEVRKILEKNNWQDPAVNELPYGWEIVKNYLIPAANTPELKNTIIYNTEVISVSKHGHTKSSSQNRDQSAFTIHYKLAGNNINIITADAVIDASGTWSNPNPIGLDGIPVPGEKENHQDIYYGTPDILDKAKGDYHGRRVLVLGSGHSAINAVIDLLKIQRTNPGTHILWGMRSSNLEKLLGGGINDELPARGQLGIIAQQSIESGLLDVYAPLEVKKIVKTSNGLTVESVVNNKNESLEVDKIIVATGYRPDLDIIRELRLDLDTVVDAPRQLAPLIDPNIHSCGMVPPHGVHELAHPDKNFYIVGMKSYGRAPTFLMLTGYEQVRSIAAELAGDYESASRVELKLPETGVCGSGVTGSSSVSSPCCGQLQVETVVKNTCCNTVDTKQLVNHC